MTVAVCFKCGEFKHGAFTNCTECGTRPQGEDDMAVSLALTDHYQSKEMLGKFGEYIKESGCPPEMPPDQKAKMIESFRKFYGSG